MSNVVAVLSPKGGTGKSTLAISLARALVLLGHDAVLLDTDAQGTARYWAELSAGRSGFLVQGADTEPELQVAVARSTADFTLLDGSAKANPMMLAAVRVADLVLVPVTPGGPDAWVSSELVQVVRAHQAAHEGRPGLAAIINRAKRNTRLYRDLVRYLDDEGIERADGLIGDRTAIAASIAEGATCFDARPVDPRATGEINHLARQVVRAFG